MAKEKIEDLSLQKLLKRKKFFTVIGGIYIGVFIVIIAIVILDLIKDGRIERSSLSGLVPIFASFWIPVIFLGEINKELKKRKELEARKNNLMTK